VEGEFEQQVSSNLGGRFVNRLFQEGRNDLSAMDVENLLKEDGVDEVVQIGGVPTLQKGLQL
jgi:hypothetical protein